MSMFKSENFLRNILLLDAASGIIGGLLFILAAGPVAGLLALPAEFLRGAGAVLLPFAAFVLWVATRQPIPARAVWIVVGLNAVWVIESIALLVGSWIAPNAVGTALVLGQAAAIAVIAELEIVGLRSRGAQPA
ncbi:hypothetical protein PY365_26480 [Roseiarcaceae bacterium H3SJ34-1]|uniref:hypothetical protein n=1 Tax=Terripilifer ovatus TaxID=3032367 RepID=UPI003AB9808C|nr:hypothetical protein [Roseiarcaceae bacterium H3SJ34-1]